MKGVAPSSATYILNAESTISEFESLVSNFATQIKDQHARLVTPYINGRLASDAAYQYVGALLGAFSWVQMLGLTLAVLSSARSPARPADSV